MRKQCLHLSLFKLNTIVTLIRPLLPSFIHSFIHSITIYPAGLHFTMKQTINFWCLTKTDLNN